MTQLRRSGNADGELVTADADFAQYHYIPAIVDLKEQNLALRVRREGERQQWTSPADQINELVLNEILWALDQRPRCSRSRPAPRRMGDGGRQEGE